MAASPSSTLDRFGRSARRNVWLYYGYVGCYDFQLWIGIWIKYLIEDRGLELRWILAMDMPFWLLVAALQVPTGALADRIGRRRLLIATGLLYSATILGFGVTTSYLGLFATYMLWAVAQSLRSGADSAFLYDSLRAAGREGEYARVAGRGAAIHAASWLVALPLGGLLAVWIGLAATVQLSAVFPLLAVGCALAMREPPRERAVHRYAALLREGFSYVWRHAEVRYTSLIIGALAVGTFAPFVLVQPFLLAHEVPTDWFGAVQTPLRVVSLVAALIAAWVQRRTSTGLVIGAACVAIAGAYLGLAVWPSTTAFALFALPALASGITDPVLGAHLNARLPSDRRAAALSVAPLLFAVQAAFIEPALGFLADGVGLPAAFAFAGGYCLLVMPVLLWLWWRAHRGASARLDDPRPDGPRLDDRGNDRGIGTGAGGPGQAG